MKSVHFGAGNIGRGFLGQLYFETGYETIFVDVVPEVVSALQTRREYPLRIVDEEPRTVLVRNVNAINGRDVAAVADALQDAELVSTAVGVKALPFVAPALAAGIARRMNKYSDWPLNIIVCENLLNAGSYLREQVRGRLAPEYHAALDRHVGFVEASIGRMVPLMTPEMKAEDPLLVCVEPYCELPVDANGFKGPTPPLRYMMPRPNFAAYLERKLFVHNAGHAVTAYLGWLRGHEYIWQAIEDPRIVAEADRAMAETCEGLVHRHGLTRMELDEHWRDLKRRFANRALGDQVARVAGDPMRKLSPNDRLIGAASMCLDNGVTPEGVAFAAAAAIAYAHPEDKGAQTVQEIRRKRGLEGVLTEVCGISMDSPLAHLIASGTQRLQHEGWIS